MKVNEWKRFTFLITFSLLLLAGTAGASLLDTEVFEGNTVLVTQKSPNCIMVTSHQLKLPSEYIIVTPTTTIKDIDNTIIKLKNLKLPCAAKIKYALKNKKQDAELIQMEVLEYGEETSKKFKPDDPCLRLPE